MTTRQEIIEKINAFLKDEITHREAYDWASEELGRTSLCEDPAGTLITLVGSYVPEEAMVRPSKNNSSWTEKFLRMVSLAHIRILGKQWKLTGWLLHHGRKLCSARLSSQKRENELLK